MSVTDDIKRELKALLTEQESLLSLLGKPGSESIVPFGTTYQGWFTRAIKLVSTLAPERLDEFVGYYRVDPKRKGLYDRSYVIQDFVNGYGLPSYDGKSLEKEANIVGIRLVNQMQILESVDSRIDTVLGDVRGVLLAEIEDHELEAARQLQSVNLRAAGSLAGVVLERHLQHVAANHGLLVKKKDPTIADLNDPLKEKGIIAIAIWRKIQLLADLRNICAHKKSAEPTKDQVTELIDGVNSIVKSVL